MSGESRGLIVLPLLFGGMPLLLGGLAVAGVAYAAVGVARAISGRNQQADRNNYYQQQNQGQFRLHSPFKDRKSIQAVLKTE